MTEAAPTLNANERAGALYPISERMAGQLAEARFGLFEPAVDAELAEFADLAAIARHLLAVRHRPNLKRGLKLGPSQLTWGGGPRETRPAIAVDFTLHDGSIDQTLTVVATGARVADLWAALGAARAAAQAEAARAAA